MGATLRRAVLWILVRRLKCVAQARDFARENHAAWKETAE